MNLATLLISLTLTLCSTAETLKEFTIKNGEKKNPIEIFPTYLRVYQPDPHGIRVTLSYEIPNGSSLIIAKEPEPATIITIPSARKKSLDKLVLMDKNSNRQFDDEDLIAYIDAEPKFYYGKGATEEIREKFNEIYDLAESYCGLKREEIRYTSTKKIIQS